MSENSSFRRPARRRWGRRQKSRWRKLLDYLLAAGVLLALVFSVARLDEARKVTQLGVPTVNDGDSLTIDGERIRLWGIDAPELHQSCMAGGRAYPCGRLARDALREIVRGHEVDCQGTDRDQYGRLLAVCTAGSVELNGAIVEAGWALAYGGYEAREAQARRAQKGLWAGEFERPRDWRDNHDRTPKPTDDFLPRVGDAIRKWLSSLFGDA